MGVWGSIPEWISLVITLLAFFGFAINQRESSILEKKNIASSMKAFCMSYTVHLILL